MKKTTNIVLINLVIIFLIFILTEYCIYKNYDKSDDSLYPFFYMVSSIKHSPMSEKYEQLKKAGYFTDGISQEEFMYRRPVGLNYKNEPIVLFGCSYLWGVSLQEKQTFHYKLSELTKRPVYNRAISGWGVQHMLYQLRREDFYRDVPKPEYVIYLYVTDHISRMYKYNFIHRLNFNDGYQHYYLKYNEKNGNLYEEKRIKHIPYSRLYNWYILRYIAEKNEKDNKKSFDLLEKHLLECRKEIDKHWGKKTKFIVLNYEVNYTQEYKDENNKIMNKENVKKLFQERIIVINTSELTDKNLFTLEFWLDKLDTHPNERAWDVITPLFVKRINQIK